MEEERKKCARDGIEHPLHFFRVKRQKIRHDGVAKLYYSSLCKDCESKDRIAKKNEDIFKPKARKTINSHLQSGKKFIGFIDKEELIEHVAMLFRREWKLHQLRETCPNCGNLHLPKLSDFTLDIIDPQRPLCISNLRILCRTCNVEKGGKDPMEYDKESCEYRIHKKQLKQGVQIDLLKERPITPPKVKPLSTVETPQLSLL